MTILNTVKVSFNVEGSLYGLGDQAMPCRLECDRISYDGFIQVVRILCGATVPSPAPETIKDPVPDCAGGPVQDLQKSDPIPSIKAVASPKKPKMKKEKIPGKHLQCPFCNLSMDTRTLHHHIRKRHHEKYDKSAVSRYIFGDGGSIDPEKILNSISRLRS